MDQIQQLRVELRAEFSSTIDNLCDEIQSLQLSLQQALSLAIDGPAIGDSIAQFYYVYLNLASQVQAMVLPQLSAARDSGIHDYNTILDSLRRVYDNPNKIQEAEDRLLSIKQSPDESLAAYIAKFERVLYEAKGQDWPEVTKISTFRKGLQSSLRNRLSQQLNLPRTYTEFVSVVEQLAGYTFSTISHSNQSAHTNSSSNTNHHNTDRMDLSALETGDTFDYEAAMASLRASRD
ncbi:Pc20g08750 [Penicillium rubens Wisconsin 54-1255]|uniref:Pc20g08750 protein n=1 Tax=Penicillium rubens (strain ATCC 28089 / DSM 1075 / NRRL 1951 / Wisconsin 54-1255) TaxID=500485 RepID=B6HEZ7_PENRW|nr:Pc20g08750 [Penicillium rubens Wisconsin 54-1255]